MKQNALLIIILSIISAIILLFFAAGIATQQNFSELALGTQTTVAPENLNGQKLSFLNFTVDENTSTLLLQNDKPFLLSFGNSQSDTINQYRSGIDHLFIYHLARKYDKYNVINLHAPNSNLQEMFLGLVNAQKLFGSKIETIFIPCVFDDTREDGIRADLIPLITNNKTMLSIYPTGKVIIENLNKNDKESKNSSNTILLKYSAENTLNNFFEEHSHIYDSRGKIRSLTYAQLYFFRNWIFGIKPTSKRQRVDAIYSRNLTALKDISQFCKNHNINVFFYIAPLRQDVEMPYIEKQYSDFKKDVSTVHKTYNLENIVPGEYWGTANGDWVDFMHFKGEGHVLLAKELEEILKKEGIK